MSKTLAIIGAGHLGQQIAHYAISDGHYKNIVFLDDYSKEKKINGIPIIGNIENAFALYNAGLFDEIIIGIGYKHLEIKKKIFEQFSEKIPFGRIIHSSCSVDTSAHIGSGSVIYPGCVIDANCNIGNNCILNVACTVAHDTIISHHCFLSPRVALAGFINIGQQCILGINCTIINNISIVPNTQIGGGAVVIKNIDKAGLYVGNPFRFIR
jgi:sugar O-acyltransferase (sialic acid O-acetyltransferase NeuD family)